MKELILIITMWIVTICVYISYVPQIIKILKTKKSEDLSITSWILWTISSLANLIYSMILGRLELIIAGCSEFLLTLATLILIGYYQYKNNYYFESELKYQDRIDKIKAKGGNHMILLMVIAKDRERRINNRNRSRLFRKIDRKKETL